MPKKSQEKHFRRGHGGKTWLIKASVHSEPNNCVHNHAQSNLHDYLSNSQGQNKHLTLFPLAYITCSMMPEKSVVQILVLEPKVKREICWQARVKTTRTSMTEQQQPYTSTAESRNQCFPPLFLAKIYNRSICLLGFMPQLCYRPAPILI